MALLCYNKGCGQRFDPEHNAEDSCLYHPGVPIFHDALKGWSCCKKRTTDFSEFLSIKGCTKGFHSKEKPPEPSSQEKTSDEPKAKPVKELIVQGPKSAEKMLLTVLPSCVTSVGQVMSPSPSPPCCSPLSCSWPHSDHPALLRMKYWSCCGIKTTDFSAFMEQPGCSRGCHCWTEKKDKKAVLCRQDWHQTGSQVVVTVYAKNPLPALSSVKANRTVLEAHVIFEGNKIFQAELELWGTIDVEKSFVSMVPAKVEIMLCKASPGSWARLELPQSKLQSCGEQEKESANTEEPGAVLDEDSDDSLSWSEEEDEEWEMEAPDMITPSN
uniref:Integrin subunit beta 1 binding protein 2 n=1 Tax=Zosterops lateralis melanops TaxID=1220523 RepID=A0A8D2NQI6_ZOSLA